ncbi:MAG: hypothetical protein QM710_00185 [Flavobacterium sp.]
MKRLIGSILLLAISIPLKGFACYFYPYGEDIRFSIFSPDNFKYNGFRIYNYTSTWFYDEDYATNLKTVTENDRMWFEHCKGKVPIEEIKRAVFKDDISMVSPNSKNAFVQYLYSHNDLEAISYLRFAKELEKLNPDADDYWEKTDSKKDKFRTEKIAEAYKKIAITKDFMLKKRYYYQIFKLLSFVGDEEGIIRLYDTYAGLYKTHDFIDNWALFYRLTAEKDAIKTNYLAAQVFVRGTDNKFDIKWYFNRHIPIDKVLSFARNNEEKANIHVLYSSRRIDQNLESIQKVYQSDPKNPGLTFLLLREINKIEDWVLTPTYTMFMPTLRQDYWENSNGKRILQRVEIDREYAKKVLAFVDSVDLDKVDDKEFWQLAKSYLLYFDKDYEKALSTIQSFEGTIKDPKVKNQCDIIKALLLTVNQEKGKAGIPKSIEKLIVNETNKHNYHFIFAIARELEMLNDKPDAAFLIAKIKESDEDSEGPYGTTGIYWKSRTGKITLFDDFYFDWYGYTDAELSTTDMQLLISIINSGGRTAFDQWKIKELKADRNKVNDLMGIKYMRDDNLTMAYQFFSKVDRNHYTNGPLFNENPFYKIKGDMNFDQLKSPKGLTKAKVVATLIKLIERAEDPKNKNRDQDYFMIANCYYNMSYHGNSWMMKRIGRTSGNNSYRDNYSDDSEYFCSRKARYYYEKARQVSRYKAYEPLCDYMMAQCDAREKEYELYRQFDNYFYVDYNMVGQANDKAFAALKAKYGKSKYSDIFSNCEIYSVYFKSGR